MGTQIEERKGFCFNKLSSFISYIYDMQEYCAVLIVFKYISFLKCHLVFRKNKEKDKWKLFTQHKDIHS